MNEQEEFEFRLRLEQETAQPSTLDSIKQGAGNLAAGAVRGAGSIGATILAPVDMARDALAGKGLSLESNRQRRADMDSALQTMGAQPDSWMYRGGKLLGEIAGTAGTGGVLANGVRAAGATRAMSGLEPIVNGVARGLETGGFRVGELAGTGLGAATRLATGGAVGATAAGMVNPEDAGTGALIGAALPGATKVAGKAGAAIRNALNGGGASQEVRALAQRAQELGINIPADRMVNSRPLNAVASSLNYVPLSGRAATEDAMSSQLNRALSKTFGQDSSNVTLALRKADDALGGQFEKTLTQNGVAFDRQLLEDLAAVHNKAEAELGADALKPISNKITEIINKGQSGVIDGKAAYAIKRDLDRLGKGSTPNAWHALELKHRLMDALNRSLGPEQASAFAQTRQHYGTMLDIEKLAKNGVEGEVSVARLANMKNIKNSQVQELANIAAQFVKPRENAHGAAQRVVLGTGAALGGLVSPGAIPALTAGAVLGRGANTALNSQMAKNFVLGGNGLVGEPETLGLLTRGAYRALPLAPGLLRGQ
jgi:hypothetical protein